MRIVEQSPDRLVLDIRPIGLMVLCVGLFLLFLVLGFGMGSVLPFLIGLMGMSDMPGVSAMPRAPGMNLLGYASVIPLLVAVFMIKTRRLSFDRKSGQISIATRGLLGRGEKTYPMAAFQGASLAASRSGTNGTTYRAMLHFSDQTGVISVTPYGTSGSGPSKLVNAINTWLGKAPGLSGGPGIQLTGDQAAAAMAALEKLGIKIPR